MASDSGPVTVSCPCGASIEVDPRTSKPVRVCPECKESLTIVVAVDPQTGHQRIGILVDPAAVGARRPGRKPPPAAPQAPACACGAQVVVDLRSVDSIYTCAWCGACYTAMAKKDPETGAETPVLLTVHVVPLKEKKATTRRMKVKTETASLPLKETLLVTSPGKLGAQALVERDRGSIVYCFCKREIAVSREASRRVLKCPDCGLSFRFFMAVDPRTGKPMGITVPQPART